MAFADVDRTNGLKCCFNDPCYQDQNRD
jgi:hypothetical protein